MGRVNSEAGSGYLEKWVDDPRNPLIEPPRPEFLLGDPAVVLPGEAPDGLWHMFANTLLGIQHYTSPDGIAWDRHRKIGPGFRANVIRDGDAFFMFYERFSVPQVRSHVAVRRSVDLWRWSSSVKILEPTLSWEGGAASRNVGNPCVVKLAGGYRLYYSAGVVFHRDLGFCEPRHIGVAHSESIVGLYEKNDAPLIPMDAADPHRNRGAGAIKVIYDPGRETWYGFNNGIFRDEDGKTRSAIMLMSSPDGLAWKDVYPRPVVGPGGDGWKKALVYQLDVKRVGGEMWMYYNARSGWRFGKERIGLATCKA
ncbi:MAG: hypothetical protein ACYC99_14720 [Candidatus Geothermincolia bacterium]